MFFKKANDTEARAWLARKQVIAWGIINELTLGIERLDADTVRDAEEINALNMTINQVKQEHEKHVIAIEGTYKQSMNEVEQKGGNENTEITNKFEKKIDKLETNSKTRIGDLESCLTSTQNNLERETNKANDLNTQCELLKQQNDEKAREISSLKSQLHDITTKFDSMTEAFNKVDKENLKNNMGKNEFEKELEASKAENRELTTLNKKLCGE